MTLNNINKNTPKLYYTHAVTKNVHRWLSKAKHARPLEIQKERQTWFIMNRKRSAVFETYIVLLFRRELFYSWHRTTIVCRDSVLMRWWCCAPCDDERFLKTPAAADSSDKKTRFSLSFINPLTIDRILSICWTRNINDQRSGLSKNKRPPIKPWATIRRLHAAHKFSEHSVYCIHHSWSDTTRATTADGQFRLCSGDRQNHSRQRRTGFSGGWELRDDGGARFFPAAPCTLRIRMTVYYRSTGR